MTPTPTTLVFVLGIGHMPGIGKKWGTVTQDQVRALVKVEPPSLLARAAVINMKSLVWGGCMYGAYNAILALQCVQRPRVQNADSEIN